MFENEFLKKAQDQLRRSVAKQTEMERNFNEDIQGEYNQVAERTREAAIALIKFGHPFTDDANGNLLFKFDNDVIKVRRSSLLRQLTEDELNKMIDLNKRENDPNYGIEKADAEVLGYDDPFPPKTSEHSCAAAIIEEPEVIKTEPSKVNTESQNKVDQEQDPYMMFFKLQQAYMNLDSQCQSYKSRMNEMKAYCDAQLAISKRSEKDIALLEEKHANDEQQAVRLNSELFDAKRAVENCERSKKEVEANLSDAKSALKEAQEEISRIKRAAEQDKNRIKNLEAKLSEKDKNIQQEINKKDHQITSLKDEINNLKKQLEEARSKNVSNKEDADKISSLEEEIKNLKDEKNTIKEESATLLEKSMIDTLTNTRNNIGLERDIENTDIAKATLGMVGIRNMKTINDTDGSEIGDQVLTSVANLLTESFANVYRYKGDMFIVIEDNSSVDRNNMSTDFEIIAGKLKPAGITITNVAVDGKIISRAGNPIKELEKKYENKKHRDNYQNANEANEPNQKKDSATVKRYNNTAENESAEEDLHIED